MDETEDADIGFQRAPTSAIAAIVAGASTLASAASDNDIERSLVIDIIAKLNMFLEDPQLLDSYLAKIIPPIFTRFSAGIQAPAHSVVNRQLLIDIAEVLYNLCKIRGQKVVTRFFANEPRNLGPMLEFFQNNSPKDEVLPTAMLQTQPNAHPDSAMAGSDDLNNEPLLTWQMRYVLMLWIAHLMLTPFDLSTIADGSISTAGLDMDLPSSLPQIACQVLSLAKKHLTAATKEQGAAANALVKISLRPDMRKAGVLESLVQWALSSLHKNPVDNVIASHGILLFLNGLLTSAEVTHIITYLPEIYKMTDFIFNNDTAEWQIMRNSTTSKKLAVKILRNIVSILLNSEQKPDPNSRPVVERMLQKSEVVESVIDFLLRALADGDTQVRYAASKAISVIATKLEPEMANDLIQAVIDSFDEDVTYDDDINNTTGVNAARWHGLTLTLSHMLFRRSTNSHHVSDILVTLHNALEFEQRSAIGNSIGSNVRDAANFGLWSLARRYTTEELSAVDLPATKHGHGHASTLQVTACQLLTAACLDPAGNVRRGSSAALQELIGRHPNAIIQGIELVQTVDYHAVGLRRRALTEVAVQAAQLDGIYRTVLLEALYDWRGINATDAVSRTAAASAIGSLANQLPQESVQPYVADIVGSIRKAPRRDVARRHGLVLALGEVVMQRVQQLHKAEVCNYDEKILRKTISDDFVSFQKLWLLFDGPLEISQKELGLASSRAHLTTVSVVTLVLNLAAPQYRLSYLWQPDTHFFEVGSASLAVFTLCIKSSDPATLEVIPQACVALFRLLTPSGRDRLMETWIKDLQEGTGPRTFGMITAIAASWKMLVPHEKTVNDPRSLQNSIPNIILSCCQSPDTDTRVLSVRNLQHIIQAIPVALVVLRNTVDRIIDALKVALNDYTINERGDVGSLVRLEALAGIECIWSAGVGENSMKRFTLELLARRLALERLDKIRLRAAKCLMCILATSSVFVQALPDVGTYDYYFAMGMHMLQSCRHHDIHEDKDDSFTPLELFLEGISSSTGAGSETLMQAARDALHDILWALPITHSESHGSYTVPSLLHICNSLLKLLEHALTSDRILLPLLETVAYLFDVGILRRFYVEAEKQNSPKQVTSHLLASKEPILFSYRTLVSLIQRAHYKSTSIPKLIAAIAVYRGLGAVAAVRPLVLEKLIGMLSHPYPKVRVAAAETLYVLTWDDGALKDQVWSAPVKENKDTIAAFKLKCLSKTSRPSGGI